MNTEDNTIVKQLQDNPMFKFSMSSLELFHSNFLEWLFHQDKPAFLKCFGVEKESEEYDIKREYNLPCKGAKQKDKKWITDIAVFAKDKNDSNEKSSKDDLVLIIENKIKSLPSKGQLEAQADRAGATPKKVLLTLFDLPSGYNLHGFESLKYIDLVEKIRNQYKSTAYSDSYVKDYCDMIVTLHEIIKTDEGVQNNGQGIFTFHNDSGCLEKCGMQDAFRKYQAAKLLQDVHAAFGENYRSVKLITGCGLNHKRACVDIFLEIKEGFYAGVQIEHDQFRVCFHGTVIEKHFDRTGKLSTDTHDFLNDLWNDLLNNISRGKKDYCKYAKSFVYRYAIIPQGVTIEQLFTEGKWLNNHPELSVKYILDKILERKEDLINKLS